MTHPSDTPFDCIENAHEYLHLLLEAAKEAQQEIEEEILIAESQKLDRRKEAMQLVSYKMTTLASHISTSRRILNDLKMLRRLLMEERAVQTESRTA